MGTIASATPNSGSSLAALAGDRVEIRYGHAEQPDALGGRQQRAHEFDARLAQEIVASDHRREAAASGDLAGSRRTSPSPSRSGRRPGLLAPGPNLVSHGLDAGLDFGGAVRSRSKVVSEPEDLRGRSAMTGRSSSPFAMPRYHAADLPKCCRRKASDFALRSAPVSIPSACIFAAVTGPTP